MLKKTLTLSLIITVFLPLIALAGEEPSNDQLPKSHQVPNEKRARLDTKGAVRGSGFRLTWIHPMRGNFAQYDKLEIAGLTSDIGDRMPAEEREKYTEDLLHSFEKAGIFKEVRKVDEAKLAERPAGPAPRRTTEATEIAFLSNRFQSSSPSVVPGASVPNPLEAPPQVIPPDAPLPQSETAPAPRSPLEAPLVTTDPASLPQESEPVAVAQAPEPKRTMVITSEVIYYKKGNRALRTFGLGLGPHRIVVRFHIYDKELGQELAMGNISGEVMEGFLSAPLLAGDADGRKQVVDALVNRVEIRRAQADQ